ncbi:TNF receptor-associated factor homolog 1a-like isoform X2 [Salvia miltiorrhiza]|uniref:TNF receptor-associated factor homolog 1a-like isoform X2 n=1 Tax=Salvia miltiorrhiza TaxID=226208 RepID=UPI0025AB7BEF|nr:TNF receptor-associated factor homolog 1a-like isoform X2 [Salvia miltiorrhiza]XP_057771383.1 TNF receptor-associated factor homolog 1a-like isoform X2 [Salvia miltiorrhiza]XP_057771384.1 TNF receptor-associated factor homolog 1a-like isoform X2 [Salvia miltiorrhiza]
MSGPAAEEPGAGRSFEGDLSEQLQQQRCESGEALAEWRSSDQVENGTPSTSPPYWDSDDDDDGGPKPSDLYGKYTWKIEKFSQINKRELRSNAFEVGGYKWYILIYPQGCDVCNHLSLFLCVANHDKLLPGWSHFAQFTIAVVNKDPKKSKYSDTLHRFWKKEHDWGWKKFMELSKVLDGFIDADNLIIKAQVQVIRERAERPFRCLDCLYRRELVRVYLTNVEQICRRFVEERRGKLGKLIEEKARWSSFCSFWIGMDQTCRRRISREKTETILKVVVKHFFVEKEVTSTLVMDSLYSGLKALEGQYKGKMNKGKYAEGDEIPVPIVQIEKDMFVLVDDVLPLLERAALEPLPPKDEKGPQNRTKDGTLGEEFNKDSIERDERRLTELGRRTIEIFILAHVFNKIEVAYQEAVALKKQEELIREEEAAWLAGIEHRAKRGAVDKEKKSKKKQAKQKRNNCKSKDKGKDDKSLSIVQDKIEQDIRIVKRKDSLVAESELLLEKSDAVEDLSDISDSEECIPEILPPDAEDRDVSPVNWDTDTSEMHPPTESSSSGISGLSSVQNGTEGRSSSVVDDSSSTCSSDSVPSVVISIPQRGNSHYQKNKKSPSRARNHQSKKNLNQAGWVKEEVSPPSKAVLDRVIKVNGSQSSKAVKSLSQVAHHSVRVVIAAEHQMAKDEDADSSRKFLTRSVDVDVSGDKEASLRTSPSKSIPSIAPPKFDLKAKVTGKKSSSNRLIQAERSAMLVSDTQKFATAKLTENLTSHRVHESEKPAIRPVIDTTDKPSPTSMPVISRPLSAPLIPDSVTAVSLVSVVPTAAVLARSVSAAGRLGLEPTAPSTHNHAPQSYRNAIVGGTAAGSLPAFTQNHSASSVVKASVSYSHTPPLVSTPMFSPHSSDWMEPNQSKPSFAFGMMSHHDRLQNRPLWVDSYQSENSRNQPGHCASQLDGMQSYDLYSSSRVRSQDHLQSGISACTTGRQNHVLTDEFPHLDIINDLLDDEHGVGNLSASGPAYQSFSNGSHYLNRHFSFPGDPAMSTSSCRFERMMQSYQDDVLQHSYGGASRDTLGHMIPRASSRPYLNGQIDGLTPNQWQVAGPDLPFPSARTTENNGRLYSMADYQNLTVDVNGYAVFRPSNGF